MKALGLVVLVALAGCMGTGSANAPSKDVPDAPEGSGHVALASETLTKRGDCGTPVFSTTVLRGPVGLFAVERPEGFHHMDIEVHWDAVVAPTMTLGAWLGPTEAFDVRQAWMVAEPGNPFVFAVDDDMWRNGSTTDLEVVFYMQGADVVNGDDAAVVAACSYKASVEMVTRATA